MDDHLAGHVPVERNQLDGEGNVPVFGMGAAHQSGSVEAVYPHIFFFFFFFHLVSPPPLTIHHYLTCYLGVNINPVMLKDFDSTFLFYFIFHLVSFPPLHHFPGVKR